jgi:hypothetical protein
LFKLIAAIGRLPDALGAGEGQPMVEIFMSKNWLKLIRKL